MKRTLKLTIKADYVTDDQDWIDAFDEMTPEAMEQVISDMFDNLRLGYAETDINFRDLKIQKLKK